MEPARNTGSALSGYRRRAALDGIGPVGTDLPGLHLSRSRFGELTGRFASLDDGDLGIRVPEFDASRRKRRNKAGHRFGPGNTGFEFKACNTAFGDAGSCCQIVLCPAKHGPCPSDLRSLDFRRGRILTRTHQKCSLRITGRRSRNAKREWRRSTKPDLARTCKSSACDRRHSFGDTFDDSRR